MRLCWLHSIAKKITKNWVLLWLKICIWLLIVKALCVVSCSNKNCNKVKSLVHSCATRTSLPCLLLLLYVQNVNWSVIRNSIHQKYTFKHVSLLNSVISINRLLTCWKKSSKKVWKRLWLQKIVCSTIC